MGMFIIANILGSSVQISMLPLPVLSTLQASGLVFNSICATLILGEPFTKWSLWGTLLVCTGAVLIAVFGAIPSPAHTLEELLDLMGRRSFILWMSFQAVLVLGIAAAIEVSNRFSKYAQHARFRLARGLAYGCISGILSAHSLLVAKSAVELVMRTISDRDNQFVHWEAWMLVLGLVTLALTQLYYLHRGLKLVSTSVLYPLVFCIYNIIAILDGLIYFQQTDLITPLHAGLITLGTVILLSGVLALSWRLSDEQHPPAVGQSTLAPGLGLVDDTESEEEVEELLLGSDVGEEGDRPPTHYSYSTFSPTQNGGAHDEVVPGMARKKSIAPSMKTNASRWTERDEIMGELEDRDTPESPLPTIHRRWSSTLPRSETLSLLHSRRTASGQIPATASGSSDQAAAAAAGSPMRRGFRRRRKSTGFPGFTARKTARRNSPSVLHDAFSSLWRLRWWRDNNPAAVATGAIPDPDTPQGTPSWTPYRDDDPEAGRAYGGSAVADLSRDSIEEQDETPSRARRGSRGSRTRTADNDSPV